MRNRAVCRRCSTTIESKSKFDWVTCKCREIYIDGGPETFRAGCKDWSNFIRLDDEDREMIQTILKDDALCHVSYEVAPKEKEDEKSGKMQVM